MFSPLIADRISVDNLDAAMELYFVQDRADGSPVAPPTEMQVMELMDYTGLQPDQPERQDGQELREQHTGQAGGAAPVSSSGFIGYAPGPPGLRPAG